MFKVWLAKFSDKGGCFYTCSLFSATAVWLRVFFVMKFKPVDVQCFYATAVWLRGFLVKKFKPVGITLNIYTFLLDALTRSWSMCDQCIMFHFEVFWQGRLFSCVSIAFKADCFYVCPVLLTRLWSMCDQCLKLGFEVVLKYAIVSLWRPAIFVQCGWAPKFVGREFRIAQRPYLMLWHANNSATWDRLLIETT